MDSTKGDEKQQESNHGCGSNKICTHKIPPGELKLLFMDMRDTKVIVAKFTLEEYLEQIS